MTEHQDSQNFADLFKRYRLRSQIDTLSHFGDLFAEEGMVYENSLFTRWQKGQRIPRDRRTILALIRLFNKRGGIVSLDEANGLLKVVGLCDLSDDERKNLSFQNKDVLINSRSRSVKKSTKNENNTIFADQLNLNECFKSSILTIKKSSYAFWILFLFFINTSWFARLQSNSIFNTFESFIWGSSYGLISFSGFIYFTFIVRKRAVNIDKTESWKRVVNWLAIGLFFQFFGLQIWTYYNITGIQIPYPSIADIGYLLTVICYLIASKYLLEINFKKLKNLFNSKKIIVFFMPIIALLFSFYVYLQTFNQSLTMQFKLIFDFSYPASEILLIFIALCCVFLTEKNLTQTRLRNTAILIIFVAQFVADYFFILAVQTHTYINGGLHDYLYLLAHTLACILILVINPETFEYVGNYRSNSIPNKVKSRIEYNYNSQIQSILAFFFQKVY